MKKITLSLNPSYLCNFRCDFCYLTRSELGDSTKIDPEVLKALLDEIHTAGYIVDSVDLYGGEIAMLKENYLNEIDKILYDFCDPTINIITNLSIIHPYFTKEHVQLSVSFDFDAREKSNEVLNNIVCTNKDISILMLASKSLINKNVESMISTFNNIKNIVSVEIKPYSSNQANQHSVSNLEYEEFIGKWLDSKTEKEFDFINEEQIKLSITKKRNAFSDDHIYILPSGNFGVLEFDKDDNEYFKKLKSFEEYKEWCNHEKLRVKENTFCSNCDFVGNCLTEHYREIESIEDSCSGFKGLLKKYSQLS